VHDAINEWHQIITGSSLGVSTIRRERNRLCMRFDTDEAARAAAAFLDEKVKPYRHLRVFKYFQEVDVRAVPFTKGLALSELAGHLHVVPENILAIGNGHNDISMLGGTVAKHCGCPANSEPEVIEVVNQAGGHIASKRSLSGVLEILDAVSSGTVRSELPPGWQPPALSPNPQSRRQRNRPKPVTRVARVNWFIGAMVYVVLVVFASFDLLPGGEIIMKPIVLISRLFQFLLSLFYR
jgi:hypothetical protein